MKTSSSAAGSSARRAEIRGGGSLVCAYSSAACVGRGNTTEPVRHSNSIAANA